MTNIFFLISDGFTTDDVMYQWKQNDSVQFAKSLFLPGGFELSDYIDGKCDICTNTGCYSCLTVDMTFKRQLSYYILTIYVPTLMIVMVSWLSFWLDHKSVILWFHLFNAILWHFYYRFCFTWDEIRHNSVSIKRCFMRIIWRFFQ